MKNKILLCTMFVWASSVYVFINAQLKVADTGKVGVGLSDAIEPASNLSIGAAGVNYAKLYVYNTGSSDPNQYGIYSTITAGTTSGSWKHGIYGNSRALGGYIVGVKGYAGPLNAQMKSYHAFGVYGSAFGANSGRNYGVYGTFPTGSYYGTGIYGTSDDTEQTLSERYAGYFRGKTYVNGDFECTNFLGNSDARLKTNISNIQSGALQKLNGLRPVQFQWRQVEEVVVEDSTTIKIPHFCENMDFEQKHYGFLAQDIQKLLPELVKENGDGYLSVSYLELIPLLVQAVQELSAEVKALKQSEVVRISHRKDISQSILYQNEPNPFSVDTRIEYQLPQNTQNATLYIYNMNGLQVAEYSIDSYGNGEVIVMAGQLDAGMYLYSLIADNQVIDTKRMILTK